MALLSCHNKFNLVNDQIVWNSLKYGAHPCYIIVHAATSGSWFSQKENKNIGGWSLSSPLQKTAIFIAAQRNIN